MVDVFHLGGADGSLDLQAGVLGLGKGAPDELCVLGAELDGNGERAVLDERRERLDAQRVDLRLLDALDLDGRDAEVVE